MNEFERAQRRFIFGWLSEHGVTFVRIAAAYGISGTRVSDIVHRQLRPYVKSRAQDLQYYRWCHERQAAVLARHVEDNRYS